MMGLTNRQSLQACRDQGSPQPYQPHAATYLLVLLAAFLVPLLPAAIASAKPAQVTEFPLESDEFRPGAITLGPDGNMWFVNWKGEGPTSAKELDRITPSGQITGFPLRASMGEFLNSLTTGPDGDLWLTDGTRQIRRVTPTGQVTEFTVQAPSHVIAAGPEGDLWFTEAANAAEDFEKISRMTPSGQVIGRFALPVPEASVDAIAAGPDGNMWFPDRNNIGRITPAGQLTEFPLPGLAPAGGIAAGPDGKMWFTKVLGVESVAIGRAAPDGQVTEFPVPPNDRPGGFGSIVAGGDGRLWFTHGLGGIWRISPRGRLTRIELPNTLSNPVYLAAGPEGAIWYTAAGEGPGIKGCQYCEGPRTHNPGIVGRITPAPLAIAIPRQRVKAKGRWVKVRLSCEEGDATDVCRGALRLTVRIRHHRSKSSRRRAVTLARRRYAVHTDSGRAVSLRLTGAALALLSRRHRLRASLAATLRGGEVAIRDIVVVKP